MARRPRRIIPIDQIGAKPVAPSPPPGSREVSVEIEYVTNSDGYSLPAMAAGLTYPSAPINSKDTSVVAHRFEVPATLSEIIEAEPAFERSFGRTFDDCYILKSKRPAHLLSLARGLAQQYRDRRRPDPFAIYISPETEERLRKYAEFRPDLIPPGFPGMFAGLIIRREAGLDTGQFYLE